MADRKMKPCPECMDEDAEDECPECYGTGYVSCSCPLCDDDHETECEECDGTGGGPSPECDACGGEGQVPDVSIPCPVCDGWGVIEVGVSHSSCHVCGGIGDIDPAAQPSTPGTPPGRE